MTLRLVLVSIVACLGLSIPSAERLERWMRSGPASRNGQVVAGDSSAPLDDGRYIVIADALDSAPAPTSAPTVAVGPSPAPVKVKVEDEAVAQAFLADWRAAIEREAAPPAATEMEVVTLDAPQEEIAPAAPIELAIEQPVVSTADERAWWDAWLAEIAQPVLAEAPVVASPAPPPTGAPDAAFSAIVDEMANAFTKDAETLAARVKADQERARLAQTPPPPATSSAEAMELDEDVAMDAAFGWDGDAEGAMPTALAAPKAAAAHENRLAHAVRLTREAVNAWASVLHGPALVTIER